MTTRFSRSSLSEYFVLDALEKDLHGFCAQLETGCLVFFFHGLSFSYQSPSDRWIVRGFRARSLRSRRLLDLVPFLLFIGDFGWRRKLQPLNYVVQGRVAHKGFKIMVQRLVRRLVRQGLRAGRENFITTDVRDAAFLRGWK